MRHTTSRLIRGRLRRLGALLVATLGIASIASSPGSVVEAQSCTYSISPTSQPFNAGGGAATIEVTTASGCPWTATVSSGGTFTTIVSGSSGTGSGIVSYTVQANTSASSRTASILVAGYSFSIDQAGLPAGFPAADWVSGDVFAGTGGELESPSGIIYTFPGSYRVFSEAGVHKEDVLASTLTAMTGCAHDWRTGDLYGTDFDGSRWLRFSRIHPHPVVQQFPTSSVPPTMEQGGPPLASLHPESVVFAANGDMYVGHADGNRDVHRYRFNATTGVWAWDRSFDVGANRQARGTDWIDLLADQRTLLYTSEGNLIFALDTVTGVSQPFLDVRAAPSFALRALPPGNGDDILVATTVDIRRFRRPGPGLPHEPVQFYDVRASDGAGLPDENTWFALNVAPDAHTFWSGNNETGNLYRFDIVTGQRLLGPVPAAPIYGLTGLCVKDEYTAAQEICGNGLDDDQDGAIDENCTPLPFPVANRPPSIQAPPSVVIEEGGTVEIPLLLSDPNDDPCTLEVTVDFSPPLSEITGTCANRTFRWTTPPGSAGTNWRFTFTVTDPGGLSASASTEVLVRRRPVAQPQQVVTPEDTPANITLSAIDTDPGDSLTYRIVSGPSHGTLTGTPPNVTYTPSPNYYGPDSFVFEARDSYGLTSQATVSITVTPVNDPPVAANDAYTTDAGATLVVPAPGVLANDTDVDSQVLTALLVSGPSNGVLVLNPDGSFTYTPNPTFVGTDTFIYQASDGVARSAPATVTITVGRLVTTGRMTAGASVRNAVAEHHTFQLPCSLGETPQLLRVQWNGSTFVLEKLVAVRCTDSPLISPNPPRGGFDTLEGSGTGRLDGRSGATARFTFTDGGEPGTRDTASLEIRDSSGAVVFVASGPLESGNQQAHK